MIEPVTTEELLELFETSEDDIHLCADGSVTFGRKLILSPKEAQELQEEWELEAFLKDTMEKEGYFRNIWSHSDHGNVTLLTIVNGDRFLELGGLV